MKTLLVTAAILALAILAGPARAESAAGSRKDQFVLQFPAGVAPEDFTIETWWLAKSGVHLGRGKIAGTQCAIDVTGADELRAILFSPKYQTVLISVQDLHKDPQRSFAVHPQPLAAIPFAGKVDLPAGVNAKGYQLEVRFEWLEGGFMNYVPGPPAGFIAATANLAADGSFKTAVPDLVHDPALAKWGGVGIGSATWHLVLGEKKPERKHGVLKIRVPGGGECFREVQKSYEPVHLQAVSKVR